MKYFLTLSLLLVSLTSFAQSTEKHIEEIRKRFYYINGPEVQLEKVSERGYDLYKNDGKLVKVIHKTDDQVIEYYFDEAFVQDGAYFIYTIDYSGGQKKENRYYFDSAEMIRWLDPDKKEVTDFDLKACKRIQLQSQAKNLWVRDNNYRLNQLHPDYLERTRAIDRQIIGLENKIAALDTIDFYEDDHGYGFHFVYKDENGLLIKRVKGGGGDHGGSESVTFYNESGQDIFSHSSGGTVFSHINTSESLWYYENGRLFRRIRNEHTNGLSSLCGKEQEITYLPEIHDY